MVNGSWLMVGILCLVNVAEATDILDADGRWTATRAGERPAARAQAGLDLTDGSRLSGHIGTMSNGVISLRHPYLGVLRVTTQEVRTVHLQRLSGSAAGRGVKGVTMANGDSFPCRVLSMSPDSILVRHEGATMPLPRSRCAALHLRPPAPVDGVRPCPPATRQFVRMHNGDVAVGTLTGMDAKNVSLKRDGDTLWAAPTGAVTDIWTEGPRFTPLSTLTPERISYTPRFDESFPVTYDRSSTSGPLSVHARLHARGIACHPRTELSYRLDGKWNRFVSEVGLADSAPRGATAAFRVTVDGKTRFEKKAVNATDSPVPVRVDIKGAKTLRLIADYGPDGSAFGAHAVWAQPMLVK